MPILGITGGIATGKSSFVEALSRHLPGKRFDADAAVHELLAEDAGVRNEIEKAFGPGVLREDGTPDRLKLRELVFAEPARRETLEAILHPAVRQHWLNEAGPYRQVADWYYVDIPLLYETGAEKEFDRVVVVACSPATQRARMSSLRGLDVTMMEKIIGAQHDLGLKVSKADHVIWNDSTVSCLDGQAKLFAGWLRNYHV
jgi:dephospho-CoA kinase